MIDKSKELYLSYRDKAKELYNEFSAVEAKVQRQLSVPLNANVVICEDGAFVEAVVWVPRSKL